MCRVWEKISGLHTINKNDKDNINNNNEDKNKQIILIGVIVVLVIAITIVGVFAFMSLNKRNNGYLSSSNDNGLNLGTESSVVTSFNIPSSEVYGLTVALNSKVQSQYYSTISSVEYK